MVTKVEVFLGFFFLLCVAEVATAFADGMLPNGNFEQGPKPSELKGNQVVGRSSIPMWQISGFVEYIQWGQKQGDMLLVVPEGSYAFRLGNEASIQQSVDELSAGMRYSLTFCAARTCAQEEHLNISASPESGVLPMQTMYSCSGWDCYAWAWLAKADRATIVIHSPGVSEDPACGPLIDSVAVRQLVSPHRTNTNLLKNGDFEEGPFTVTNSSWGVIIPPKVDDDHSPLPGWMVESLKAVRYLDAAHFSVPRGGRAVELLAGKESAIAQVVRTEPGRRYALTFAVGDAGNACSGHLEVEAFAGENTLKVAYESKGRGGFKRAVLQFTAARPRTRVVFWSSNYNTRSDDRSSLCGPVIDDVALVSVRREKQP